MHRGCILGAKHRLFWRRGRRHQFATDTGGCRQDGQVGSLPFSIHAHFHVVWLFKHRFNRRPCVNDEPGSHGTRSACHPPMIVKA